MRQRSLVFCFALSFASLFAQPAVRTISPPTATACGPTFNLTVFGIRFQSNSLVLFDQQAVPTTVASANPEFITAQISSGLIAQYRTGLLVGVFNRDGANPGSSNSIPFALRLTPVFLNPTTPVQIPTAASASGSTPLTLQVTNLDPNSTHLHWGTRYIFPRLNNGSQATFDIPNELLVTPGTVRVSLVNADDANPEGLDYTPLCSSNSFRNIIIGSGAPVAPTLSRLTPDSATACGPAFLLTVAGSGFQQTVTGSPGSTIQFGGSTLSPTNYVGTSSPPVVTGTVGAPQIATYRSPIDVTVSNSATVISRALPFTLRQTPIFTGSANIRVPVSTNAAGTTPITFDVANFSLQYTRLRWVSRLLSPRTASSTQATFDIPNDLLNVAGTRRVSLVNVDEANPNGVEYSLQCAPASARDITITPAAAPTPTITRLSPTSATACGPGFNLSITGSNFTNESQVRWGQSAVPSVSFVSATSLIAPVDGSLLGATGRTVVLTVANVAGPTSATFNFIVLPPPAITSFTPAQLPPSSGAAQQVTATGTNFLASTRLLLRLDNGAEQVIQPVVVSSTSLRFTVPADLPVDSGSVLVLAFNADEANPNGLPPQTLAGCPQPALLNIEAPAPTIRSLEPSSEVAARATPLDVIVNGSNFTSTTRVLVNGTAQDATFVSAQQLRITLSTAQLARAASLNITLDSGSGSATFQVLPVPVPTLTLTATPSNPTSLQDLVLQVNQSNPSPRPLRMTLGLSFQPNADNIPAGGLPLAAQPVFAGGGQTLQVDVPSSGSTIPLPSAALVRPGTIAGTVVVRVTALNVAGSTETLVLPNPAPEVRITLPRTAPVIDSVSIVNVTASGFNVELIAISPVRNLTSAVVQFNVVAGRNVSGPTSFTVDLQSLGVTWFAGTDGLSFGSQFKLRIPFTLSGDISTIESATVTVSNSVGASSAVTGRRQ